MAKHTPGPWKIRRGLNERFIDAPGLVCLAVVGRCVNNTQRAGEMNKNAALIAAAPELADNLAYVAYAAEGIEDVCDEEVISISITGKGLKDIRAALKKAGY